jgi:hypothetical protein
MLVMPSEEEARRVVAEMARRPDADYSTLVYPVYLPILAERAAAGDERALTALGRMPTQKRPGR